MFTHIQTDVNLASAGSTDAYAPGRTGSGSSKNQQPPQPSHHDTGSLDNAGSGKGLTGTTGVTGMTVTTGGHPLSGTSTRHKGTLGAGGSGSVGGGGGSGSLVGGGGGSGSMGDRHGSSSRSRAVNRGGSRIPNNCTSGSGSGRDLEAGEGEGELRDGEFTSPIGISSFGAPSVDNFGCDV